MERVTILYTDELLPYCPTVLSINTLLRQRGFDVTIVTYTPLWCDVRSDLPNVVYRPRPRLSNAFNTDGLNRREMARLYQTIRRFVKGTVPALSRAEQESLETEPIHMLKALDLAFCRDVDWSGVVIAVDSVAAFAASLRQKPFLYLSLELYGHDLLKALIRREFIAALLIQSVERQRMLLPDFTGPVFLLPNSPVFKNRAIPVRNAGELIFAGTAWELFGFDACLNFLRDRPDLRMTHIGFCPETTTKKVHEQYGVLLDRQQLVFDARYRTAEELVDSLAGFRIGFCLYQLELARERSRENYLTAPSGKLGNYLAAGVPVICSDLPAFQFVRDQRCGALVPNLSPECLGAALREIEEAYEEMSRNALAVARTLCFSTHFDPVMQFLGNHTAALSLTPAQTPDPRGERAIRWTLLRFNIKKRLVKQVSQTIRWVLSAIGVLKR